MKPFCMELNQKTINAIDVNITFQDENQRVHFSKGDWEINLLIDYTLDLEKKSIPNTIHKSIKLKMERYEKMKLEDKNKQQDLKKIVKGKINKNKNNNIAV